MADKGKTKSVRSSVSRKPTRETAKTTTNKSRGSSASAKTKKRSAEIKGITLIALGIFMVLSFFGESTGVVGKGFKSLLMGLFGGSAVVFFVFSIWTGINMFMEKHKERAEYKIWILVALMIVTSVLGALWNGDTRWGYKGFVDGIQNMYINGASGGSGVLGELLCIGLVKFLGTVGTTVLSIALGLILVLILTEVSLEKVFDKILYHLKKKPG